MSTAAEPWYSAAAWVTRLLATELPAVHSAGSGCSRSWMPPIISAEPDVSSNTESVTEQFRLPVSNHSAAVPMCRNAQELQHSGVHRCERRSQAKHRGVMHAAARTGS